MARLKTEKSGGKIGVTIELLPTLIEALETGPVGDLAFICGVDGKPMRKELFGNAFKDACRAAGVDKSVHGLRKLAATAMANNEATNHQLNATLGWTGNRMASLYTQAADTERLGLEASGKLMNDQRTSIPSPNDKVRAPVHKW